jgi:Tol biopolymer transport system component
VVDVKSGAQRLLTPTGYNDSLPSWSPDGRWIAVLSNRDGGNAVYQVDALNGEGQRLAAVEGLPSPSMPPLWSSDGQWLTVFTSKYVSNVSSNTMTYVVAAADRAIALQLEAFQTIFAWQPG